MILDAHKHLFYNVEENGFPLVFVDNNPGYICYSLTPVGYKGTSLDYNGIKEAGGVNFYCTNQSIGGCFFINGSLYSLTDVRANSWFNLSVDIEASMNIFSAHMVSEFKALVVCLLNVDPSVNRVIYSSKTIDIRSMLLSSNSLFYESDISEASKATHMELFNEDFIYTGDGVEDYYDDLTYNGAYGFSDKKIVTLEIGADVNDARAKISEEVIKDLCSLMNIEEDKLTGKSIYAVDTSIDKDGSLAIIGVSSTHIYGVSEDSADSVEFKSPLIPHKQNNINYSTMIMLPKTKKKTPKNTYYPLGVFRHSIPTPNIILNRFENIEGQTSIYGAEYNITVKYIDGKISLSMKNDENEKALPTTLTDTKNSSIEDMRYAILGWVYSVNIIPLTEGDILGRIHGVKHLYGEENTIPNQVSPSEVLRSIALARQYSS
ncbi:hypothetical protein JHD46_07855 [Sulfurimonas sp. SAG-AH-194-C20]|nr:hypothetical protein [Sulfurimonas sp. SAG-AH-194-C20]MDF1879547.1 hypothetical protein [Sulfurimonas sp. SAG-AH-194-C20]